MTENSPALPPPNTALTGMLLALGGSVMLSVNDVAIKFLSGSYPLHQVILTRAVVGLAFLMLLVRLSGGSFRQLRTRRPLDHLIRVSIVMVSNATYFLGLAAMPLADAVAVAFVSPVFVTLLSAVLLKETVGLRRWSAVVAGMIGVIIFLRPGSGVFQPAAVLVLISAFCYASSHMMTRRMRATESAVTLSFFVQCGFVIVSVTMGLVVGDGRFAGSTDASLRFLLMPWHWPPLQDLPAFLATALSVTIGGLMVSQAYRTCEAALIAPFEYAGMPMAIFWGVLVFGTWPDAWGWRGIALICGAGLYTLWRETRRRQEKSDETASRGV